MRGGMTARAVGLAVGENAIREVEIGREALMIVCVMTRRARQLHVRDVERPSRAPMIEGRNPTSHRLPPHQIEATAVVVVMASVARRVSNIGRSVKPQSLCDAVCERGMLVTAQALRVRDLLGVLDVARDTLRRRIEGSVARGQHAGRIHELCGGAVGRDSKPDRGECCQRAPHLRMLAEEADPGNSP